MMTQPPIHCTAQPARRMPNGLAARAYSLAELLVVMAIIVLMLALALPAFKALRRTTSESTAEISLQQALSTASAYAQRRAPGEDVVAAFVFTSEGLLTVLTMERVGVLTDQVGTTSSLVDREVFVPASEIAPVEFEKGWWVFGLTPVSTIDSPTVGSFTATGNPSASNPDSGWYDTSRYVQSQRNWVFPETHFVGTDTGDVGRERQTFVVRFEGGTGRRRVDALGTILLVLPVDSVLFRTTPPWDISEVRLDTASNMETVVRRLLEDQRVFAMNSAGQADQRRVLGDIATDSVLARPVTQLALVEARRAVSELGARRLNTTTGCFYRMTTGDPPTPEIDTSLFPGSLSETDITSLISDWIEHRIASTTGNTKVESSARLFTVEVAGGALVALDP